MLSAHTFVANDDVDDMLFASSGSTVTCITKDRTKDRLYSTHTGVGPGPSIAEI